MTATSERTALRSCPDADESTKVKNPNAKMSKAVHRISKRCSYRLILTGSPVTQNVFDLYSQYKVLNEDIFGTSYYAFKNKYALLGQYNQPVSWKNLPELVKKAHSIAFRVTKADALSHWGRESLGTCLCRNISPVDSQIM